MYGIGMSNRQISDQINDIYGFEVSADMVSAITDKILPEIEDWQNRILEDVYPIVFIDAIHFSVKSDGIVIKKAAYVILAVTKEGKKEVLGICIGENESAKFWLNVLNNLKNRGIKDILIICADGLKEIKEAIEASFPNTEHQRCIVLQIKNTLKYVSHIDKKAFAADLKKIYTATNEKDGYELTDKVNEKIS